MTNRHTIRSVRPQKTGVRQVFRVLSVCLFSLLMMGMGAGPPQVGGPAPNFTLKSFEGRDVTLSALRGKVVLLNFWATWCEPCKKEMPAIQTAYEQYKSHGLVVLAVNFGERSDNLAALVHHGQMTFPILLDPDLKVAEAYAVRSLPVTFFIDAKGMIRERIFGGTLTNEGIGQTFEKMRVGQKPS